MRKALTSLAKSSSGLTPSWSERMYSRTEATPDTSNTYVHTKKSSGCGVYLCNGHGCVHAPAGPGLGHDINLKALEKSAVAKL